MEQVVAWPGPSGPGFVNLHWKAPEGYRGIWGTPFKEVGPFIEAVQHHTANPLKYPEIYFCLSVQHTTGEQNKFGGLRAARAMEGATLFKACWLDIDVKGGSYATIEEATAALEQFRKGTGLPEPSAIVHSGGGLHIYWISDRPLTQEEWRPYAYGLYTEALKHGLKCDRQCTTNPVQLLRIPGTTNNKIKNQPRAVRLVHLGTPYQFDVQFASLARIGVTGTKVTAAETKPVPFDLSAFKTGPAKAFQHLNAGADNLASGIKHYNDSPLDPTEIFAKCGHYREALKTGGKDHANNLWALSVLGCTWFINGRSFAHAVSSGHKTYLKVETDIKYDEKVRYAAGHVGWPSCKSFEGAGSKVCATCLFKGKIKSPLNLAQRVAPCELQSVVASCPPPGLALDLPSKYTINEKGFICEKIDRTLPNKTKIQEFEPLFYCKLKDFEAQSGERRLNFMTSLDGKNWGFASLSESVDLISEQAMVKALRRFGVKPCPNNQRKITEFVTSFMAKLDAAKERNRTLSFGWLYPPKGEDNPDQPAGFPIGFAYGGQINMSDGTSRAGGFSDQQIEEFYQPQGDEKYWWELLYIITAQHHPALEVVSLTGMAAPLMAFTGEYNGIFCAWSPESGATKSTAIAVGASVWANPKLTKERPFSTQKGIIRKLGYLKNLPVYWDEINKDEKMDDIVDILGQLTEGGGGSRLKSDRTMHDIEQWQTLMLVGSNQSLVAAIQRQVKNTDAQLERVFEFQVPKREYAPEAQHAVSKIVDKLNTNYGKIGLKYGTYIGMHPKEVQALVDEVDTVFCRAVIPGNQERFRKCMAVTVYSAAVIANTHLGTDYHLTEIWDFLVEKFLEQRSNIVAAQIVAGTANHTQNTCTQFFKAHNRNALWVKNVPVSKRGRPPAIAHIAGPTKERPDRVDVRLAIDDRMIHISKTRFLEYLTGVKVTGRTVINGLIKHFNANEVGRLDLALGAGVIGGRESVIEIPVPAGSPFEQVLFAHTPPDRPDGVTGLVVPPPAPTGLPKTGTDMCQNILEKRLATAAVTVVKDLELVRAVSANTAPLSDPKGS